MDEVKKSRKKAKKESSFSLNKPRKAKSKALERDFKTIHSGAGPSHAKEDSRKEKVKKCGDCYYHNPCHGHWVTLILSLFLVKAEA